MYIIKQTEVFTKWLRKLRDLRARIAIARRIERAQKGNLGDHRSVGKNLLEMRLTTGPGYRIYYTLHNNDLIILLVGGDKSTQQQDINRAKELKKEYLT